MNEDVGTIIAPNESVTFCVIEPFHRSAQTSPSCLCVTDNCFPERRLPLLLRDSLTAFALQRSPVCPCGSGLTSRALIARSSWEDHEQISWDR
jgi:hypothetical protein